MRIIQLLLISFLVVSCATTSKVINTEEYNNSIRELYNSRIISNKETVICKDSNYIIKAKSETSNNIIRDTSYLETSYAYSYAYRLSNGNIKHTLSNKDSIESIIKYVYIYKDRLINDTIHINNTDTIYKDNNVEVVEYVEPTIKEKLYYMFIGASLLVLIYLFSRLKKSIL